MVIGKSIGAIKTRCFGLMPLRMVVCLLIYLILFYNTELGKIIIGKGWVTCLVIRLPSIAINWRR